MYGALTAVLSNAENKHYTENVLSKIDFPKEFTSITKEERDNARRLVRLNPCEPIIWKDRKRKSTLETKDNLAEKDLKTWVESIKI